MRRFYVESRTLGARGIDTGDWAREVIARERGIFGGCGYDAAGRFYVDVAPLPARRRCRCGYDRHASDANFCTQCGTRL